MFHNLIVFHSRGSKGGRTPTAQNVFNFMQFSDKFVKILCWRFGDPSYGESWILLVSDSMVLCLLFSNFLACRFYETGIKFACSVTNYSKLRSLQIVDGTWSEWSAWVLCSITCGGGLQWRNRSCDGAMYGGNDCVGAANESRVCSTGPCPGTRGTSHGQVYSSIRYTHPNLLGGFNRRNIFHSAKQMN